MTAPSIERARAGRFPGAAGTFALLGEVLWVGVLVTLVSLPLVTAPAAIAAGVRHLDRHLHARETSVRLLLRDVRAALRRGGLAVGAVTVAALGAVVLQLLVVPTLGMPGSEAFTVVAAVVVVAGITLLVTACASWSPARSWRCALTWATVRMAADPVGSLLTLVAVGLTALAAWQLPPLLVPAIGCLVFALVVVRSRRRRRVT